MKNPYIIILLAVAFIGLSFKPQGKTEDVSWYSWNDAYPVAKKDKKLILIDVYTNWCGWCKKMDRDVFSDRSVQKLLSENFVNVKMNPERTDESYTMDTVSLNGYQMYNLLTNGRRSGFPTIVVLDPTTNKIIHAESGYMSADEFTKTMKQVISKYEDK